MQSRASPSEWVPTVGLPPLLLMMFGGDVVAEVVLALLVFYDSSIASTISQTVAVGALVALGIANVASALYFTNQFRPNAVRAAPDGVELRPQFGAPRLIPWSLVRIPNSSTNSRFEPFQYRAAPGRSVGLYFVTAEQALTLRSSPFRPAAWPETGPWPGTTR
ncbi:MAG: hypothetical protein L3K18_08395 [Thermoplasmata archaeon]|nr:hypothetical protein [Thermoplasmata archaeon]